MILKIYKHSALSITLALVLVLTLLILTAVPVLAKALFESWEGTPDNYFFRSSQSGWTQGQTFTAESNHSVSSVELMMYRTLNPGLATISIWETGAHFPTGTALTSATINGDSLPQFWWNAAWREIEFATPCEVTAGHKYAIVIEATCNSPAEVGLRVDDVSPVYPGGEVIFNKQGSWTYYGDNETILFRVYGEPEADLAISKIASPNPVIPGAVLTYIITVTNNGPANATEIVVTDILPPSLTFVSADTHGAGAYNSISGNWSGFNLTAGDTATLTIKVKAPVVDGAKVTNNAQVSSNEVDPNPANNFVSQDTSPTSPVIASKCILVEATVYTTIFDILSR
jgi:uncharacterized repeat protein (TIGR01451 family)